MYTLNISFVDFSSQSLLGTEVPSKSVLRLILLLLLLL
jgi:hypothetical protein